MLVRKNEVFLNEEVEAEGVVFLDCIFVQCEIRGIAKSFIRSQFWGCKDAMQHTNCAFGCVLNQSGMLRST